MTRENRAVMKRLACLLCSLGTLVCYSYLVGGVGGYLVGQGRPLEAAAGFVSGTALALAAVALWRSYLGDIAMLAEARDEAEELADGRDDVDAGE